MAGGRDSVGLPAQLPGELAVFVGRAEAGRRLDAVGAGGVVVIAGTAGVGKTTLAVRWARRVAGRFPGGQLYVNLRGHDPAGAAVTAGEALRGFLVALGVSPERVPEGVGAQAGLFRSLLAGRRVLVVLDNARDAEQVRPLLPGTPGCLALITSRTQLTSLVAAEGAQLVSLDLLSATESRELLAARLGSQRLAGEPDAVDTIVERCARLPLALAIVAARAATHPGFSLAALAAELGGLDAFVVGDAAVDVRTVFSWSYRHLGAGAARLFRLFGVHPGPDLTVPVAASLAGLPAAEVRPLLAALARAHLVTEHAPGRYTCHDLLRQYATELAAGMPDRDEAVRRVLDHYLHTAQAAAVLVEPQRLPWQPNPPRPGVVAEKVVTQQQALAWFTAERAGLLACLHHARGHHLDVHTWQLACATTDFLDRQGHWHDWLAVTEAALAAAGRLGDRAAQAHVHRSRAKAYVWLGREPDAHEHLRQALNLYTELGDGSGRAHTERSIAWLLGRQGRRREAAEHAETAVALAESAGDRAGQALGLNTLGWQRAHLGEHERAMADCTRALALFGKLDDRNGAAHALDSVGFVHHRLGDHAAAAAHYRQAVELYRHTGDRYHEANTLVHLGDTHEAAGDTTAAHAVWRCAVEILERLGHPSARGLRTRLRDPRTRAVRLSEREHAVLVAYVSGMTLTQAARHVGVRPETAKTYLARVREKYAQAGRPARTKLELAARARADGLSP